MRAPRRFATLIGMALVGVTLLAGGPAPASPPAADAPETTNVLVVLVRWSGNPADSTTLADANSVVSYMDTWLESASRGQVTVTGQARDWTTIPSPGTDCDEVRPKTLAGLATAGVDVAAFDEIVAYFGAPLAGTCGFSGSSGYPLLVAGSGSVRLWPLRNVIAHELGHNWGLGHSTALKCIDDEGYETVLSPSASCTAEEYGDPFDIMGKAAYAGSFNAPGLVDLGWLRPAELRTIDRSPGQSTTRTITLTPLTAPGFVGTRAIRVAGVGLEEWWIENRYRTGVDTALFTSYLTSPTAQGVQVRRVPYVPSGYGRPQLLDMHPETSAALTGGSFADGSLGANGTWTTPDRSVTITQGPTTGAGGSQTVTLTLREVPAAPAAPTVVKGDGQATVSWTAPANGGLPIDGYVVTPIRNGAAQPSRTFASTATSQVITGLTPGSTYTFKVAARNALGTSAASAASAPVSFLGPFQPFTSWDALVARQLTDFAGSPGTVASRAAFVQQLGDGSVTPADFIVQRIDGPWYGPIVGPVSRLYWAYFRRTPDVAGVTYWAGRRRAGSPLDTVSQSFAGSAEFTRTYGSLTNRAFVELVYTNVLGRPGEESGMAYWTSQLDQRKKNRGQVMRGFSESAEFKAKKLSDVNAFMAYAGMLGRAPTSAELTAAKATTRAQLVETIRLSAAYASRVG